MAQSISPITVPQSNPPRMIQIPSGRFTQSLELRPRQASLPSKKSLPIASFSSIVCRSPNSQFLEFVNNIHAGSATVRPRLLVDDSICPIGKGSLMLGPRAAPNKPVTQVSWFAAKAYCEARGSRLPTEEEGSMWRRPVRPHMMRGRTPSGEDASSIGMQHRRNRYYQMSVSRHRICMALSICMDSSGNGCSTLVAR